MLSSGLGCLHSIEEDLLQGFSVGTRTGTRVDENEEGIIELQFVFDFQQGRAEQPTGVGTIAVLGKQGLGRIIKLCSQWLCGNGREENISARRTA